MLGGKSMERNINQFDISKGTYTADDIMKILNIGKTAVYDLIKDSLRNNKNFKVIKIGKLYRVPKTSFDDWFQSKE